jgi:hypothetical protein
MYRPADVFSSDRDVGICDSFGPERLGMENEDEASE